MGRSVKANFLAGAMITAGTAVGAGMFSIPIVSSGMWFVWTILALILLWAMNYLSGLYLLEVNLGFERGSSFDQVVKGLIGPFWNGVFGLGFAFLMIILLYAYFSAFGNMAGTTLQFSESKWSAGLLSLVFGLALGVIVWWSTNAVGRISSLLIVGMIVTFLLSMGGFSMQVEVTKLMDTGGSGYFTYFWVALSYLVTAFGFSTVTPSLYKHYGAKPLVIRNSLLFGSLLALAVYVLFVFVIFGNISRTEFVTLNATGGNIGDLVGAMQAGSTNETVNFAISLFSNFAIISSFLGVGLCLFDYFADRFSLPDTRKGRFFAACLTFLPPSIASFFFPNGFIAAIGYAGLVGVLIFGSFFFLVRKSRSMGKETGFRVPGGNALMYVYLGANLIIACCQVLNAMGYLPKW